MRIDRRAAQQLADWYQLGADALAAFAAAVPGDEPSSAQLWPEHFDLGISAEAAAEFFHHGRERAQSTTRSTP